MRQLLNIQEDMRGCQKEYNIFKDKNLIIMQYTNLKDNQGKEIFEGDIVTDINSDAKNSWGIVTMNPSEWVDDFIKGDGEAFCYKGFMELIYRNRIKAIGNIYQNKGLLNEYFERRERE